MALLDTRYPDRADMGGGPDVYARWGRIMTEWREELIEKMARYIACASSSEDDPDSEWCDENWPAHENQARAALAVAEPVIREQTDIALREENELLMQAWNEEKGFMNKYINKIEHLRAEKARLREALGPIVKIKAFTCIYEWTPVEALRDDEEVNVKLTGAQIKKMREAAIREGGKDEN